MFPCMIAKNSTIEIISSGMGGTRNGAIHLVTTYINCIHTQFDTFYSFLLLIWIGLFLCVDAS